MYELILDASGQEKISGMTHDYPYCMHVTDIAQFTVPWHWHEEAEFNYVRGGGIEVLTNNNHYMINDGEGYFTNSNVMSTKRKQNGCLHAIEYSHMFHPVFLSGHYKSVFETHYVDPIVKNKQIELIKFSHTSKNDRAILKKIRQLSDLQQKEQVEFETRNLLSELWLMLIQWIAENRTTLVPLNLPNQDRIRLMMNYISLHYMEKITLKEVSDCAGISERECIRCFQRNLNCAPFDYIQEIRLEKARELLQTTSASITEISLLTGFSASAYFGKLFRETYHMTPKEYRKNSLSFSQIETSDPFM